jgi:biopolymer transport protein ExbB/TolQ
LALVIGVLIIKKVASCLIKTVVGLIVLAILAYVFYTSMM